MGYEKCCDFLLILFQFLLFISSYLGTEFAGLFTKSSSCSSAVVAASCIHYSITRECSGRVCSLHLCGCLEEATSLSHSKEHVYTRSEFLPNDPFSFLRDLLSSFSILLCSHFLPISHFTEFR